MIAWFARNHVAANLLMLSILVIGLGSLRFNIPLEVFPSVEPRSISVAVAVPGAMPEQMEASVSIRLEEAVQDLEGIDDIVSRAREGVSTLVLSLNEDYDPQVILAEVKSRIDSINNLPDDARRPVVKLAKRLREVISVAVVGELDEREIRLLSERIRDQLLQKEVITQVELDGIRGYELAIEVNKDTLREYQLNLADIAQAVNRSSQDMSGGTLKTKGGDILIRSSGQAYTKEDFANIVVLNQPDGSIIRLGQVAKIIDGFTETPILTRFNGKRAAMVEVYRVGNESAIEVADTVIDFIEEIKPSLPHGVELITWRDRSKIVKKRLKTLTDNAIQGGILVLLLLTLFLRPAIAFWVVIGIPVSFMGAFMVMPLFDISLNVISLFGFIVILGIVVDDAIVTGENIYSHLRRSENSLDAVINGTREVAVPVTFGILTTVAAFLPIAFLEGARAPLFAAIPIVVIPILLFSLIESKLVLPAHLKHIDLTRSHQKSRLQLLQLRFADGFERAVLKHYQPALTKVLEYRYLFLSISFGCLIILITMYSSGWMKFIFFPKVQSELARATLIMPVGTPIEITDRHVLRMLEVARELQEKHQYVDDEGEQRSVIRNIRSTSGSGSTASGSHYGRVYFEITPPEERATDITSVQLVEEWRRLIGTIPGAETLTFRAEIGRVSDPIDIQLKGQNFASLREVSDRIKQKLRAYPSVFDVEDTYSDGKQALEMSLKQQAYALGFSRQDIMSQVSNAFYGFEAQRIQRGRDDIRVVVRYPREQRQSIDSLQKLLITNGRGDRVPLYELVELEPEISPATIYRIDRYRTISVRADLDKNNTNMLVLQQELRDFIDDTLVQFPGIQYTFEGEAKEQRQSFGSLKLGLLFVMFIIYSLLAIPFKSYWQPIVVMAVIPFGAIGAIGGHWLMGMDITLISLLGMLALTGIVVNDSLVLVDFVNKRRQKTQDLMMAVTTAAASRFRPVILTSLTTFIGLMPLLFEKSTQAQFLIPMAVSLGFGILFATAITLFLVPVNYVIIEDIKQQVKSLLS